MKKKHKTDRRLERRPSSILSDTGSHKNKKRKETGSGKRVRFKEENILHDDNSPTPIGILK